MDEVIQRDPLLICRFEEVLTREKDARDRLKANVKMIGA